MRPLHRRDAPCSRAPLGPLAAVSSRIALPAGMVLLLGACSSDSNPSEPANDNPPAARLILVPEDALSLGDAVNGAEDGDTVSVAAGTYSGAGNRGIEVRGIALHIRGRDPENPPVFDPRGADRVFRVLAGGRLVLRDVVLRGGAAPLGGAVRVEESSATLERVEMSGCVATYGGAVHTSQGNLSLLDCRVAGNRASELDGGAIYATRSTVSVRATVIMGNAAAEYGGALRLDRSELDVAHSTIAGNLAASGAGGIEIGRLSRVDLADTILRDNGLGTGSPAGADARVASSGSLSLGGCVAIRQDRIAGEYAPGASTVVAGDPLFCDPVDLDAVPTEEGDVGLLPDSPCAAANSPCGTTVGARDIECVAGEGGREQ